MKTLFTILLAISVIAFVYTLATPYVCLSWVFISAVTIAMMILCPSHPVARKLCEWCEKYIMR